VLVIFAALAACSTRDATAATELLSQDSTLSGRLATAPAPGRVALPAACAPATPAARPQVEHASQAEELAHRGYAAEALGDLQEARALLRRASELDGTNEPAAYHLGRTSEALGDRAAAVAAYCRFLALSPTTAESADARQRVASLSQPAPRVAADTMRDGARDGAPAAPRARVAPARPVVRQLARKAPVARRPSTAAPRVASATVERSSTAPALDAGTGPTNAAAAGGDAASSGGASTTTSAPSAEGGMARTVATGDVVPAAVEGSTAVQPSTTSRTSGGGLSRAQRAGLGAAAGAIIGAVTGRSVKGALIGAAAGGALGTATGGRMAPVGRGISPVGRGIRP
jgi:hypothetical protein